MAPLTPAAAAPQLGRSDVLVRAAAGSRQVIAGVLLVALVLASLVPDAAAATLTVLVAGFGFLAGVPHGAVDHLLLCRLAGRSLAEVTFLYAAIAVTAWALLTWAGAAALLVVVALSVVHFGLGELQVWRESTGWRPGGVVSAAAAVAGTGALLLPLAFSGDLLGAVAKAMSPDLAVMITAGPVRLGAAVAWSIATCVAAIAALRARRPMVVLDLVLIGAVGAFLPPLVAFAVWFGGWHAVRHAGRLLAEEPGCAVLLAAGRTRLALLRFGRLAALPSVAALAVVAVLAVFGTSAADPETAIAEVLKVLLALTVPHMLVVLWLDRRDGRVAHPGAAAAS